ncbi:MAG TPA: hypothetical protein PKZ26_00020 [Anaerolineaceae bacterium]|jgi:hypothetical protein|nr:hypothetical protein [Anaerolineaceae bacterium]NMC17869.1 hypothetical protein [Chloroflexota bacterium]HNS06414.1 hypothetical protein [Anaerolineaceae bacterium]HNW13823.1 hypothetical protein [Anaerolineaceae bacterium]HOE02785.1 hypothetical protein [Anaerolineaceae bacterium]
MLDDLRNSVNSAYEEELIEEEHIRGGRYTIERPPFLGMSPFQRFIVALVFFLMVAILGILLLVVFQKIMPPI